MNGKITILILIVLILKNTLPAPEHAFLRLGYQGHISFRDNMGESIRQLNIKGGKPEEFPDSLNKMYLESLND